MDRPFRTDLAAEQRELTAGAGSLQGVRASSEQRSGFEVSTVEILDQKGADALCKPIGKYITLGLEPLIGRASDAFEDAAGLLAGLIRELLPTDDGKGTLVAGLGNDEMTPDAVGPLAVNAVIATRHLKRGMPDTMRVAKTMRHRIREAERLSKKPSSYYARVLKEAHRRSVEELAVALECSEDDIEARFEQIMQVQPSDN